MPAWQRIDRPVELVVTGPPSRERKHSWVRFLTVPREAEASYPVLAAWLAQKGPYPLGLLPPGTRDPCPMTTILEHAALGAITITSNDEARIHAFGDVVPIPIAPPSFGCLDGNDTCLLPPKHRLGRDRHTSPSEPPGQARRGGNGRDPRLTLGGNAVTQALAANHCPPGYCWTMASELPPGYRTAILSVDIPCGLGCLPAFPSFWRRRSRGLWVGWLADRYAWPLPD